jgi:hypothetical protein
MKLNFFSFVWWNVFNFFGFLGWSARGAGYGRSSASGSAQEKTNAKKETKGKEFSYSFH